MEEKDVILFQIQRKFINLNKDFLEKLELNHQYIKRLEKLLFDSGFENFKISNFDYKKDRGYFLGKTNDAIRELQGQLELFDISFKKN